MSKETPQSGGFGEWFAMAVYRWRWLTAALALTIVGVLFAQGIGFVGTQTSMVLQLGDVSDGSGSIGPQIFDPSLDVWFTGDSEAMRTFYEIEDRFVAEDYLVVAFEVLDKPNGVFDRETLGTIARLTDEFLKIPGVRHVRSLTRNPWIRWGTIEDEFGAEEGLIITDLVEEHAKLSEADIVERMVAVLGAPAVAKRLGAARVRAVIGEDADFEDYIGEPLLLGTLVNEEGTATAIQIQVIRPYLPDDTRSESGELAADLYSVQYQRRALRGVEHILRREAGVVAATAEFTNLAEALREVPSSPEKTELEHALGDPSKAFVVTLDGEMIQKYHEYKLDADGQWVDSLGTGQAAPAGFTPAALSSYTYRLAGVPTFERNFETTGTTDAALLPLAWLVIFIGLFVLFRNLVGAVIPMIVVVVSILGTVGSVFWSGHLFNNLTAMLPNMMTVIGVADSVHLVAAYLTLRPQYADRQALLAAVIKRNALPVFLTSITTTVGFYSLVLINLQPVQELGAAMGFGSLLAYVVTMTLVPLLLSFLPIPKKEEPKKPLGGLFSGNRPDLLAGWVVRHTGAILLVSLFLTVLALGGVSLVRVNADPRTMFPPDNKVIVEMQWIEDRLGGVGDLELVFSAAERGSAEPLSHEDAQRLESLRVTQLGPRSGLQDMRPLSGAERDELSRLEEAERQWQQSQIGLSAAFLQQLDRFEARLRSEMDDPESPLRFLTDLTSPLDILRKIHQVQNENRAEQYRIPQQADVHPDSRAASLAYDDVQQRWFRTPGQDASTLVSQYYLQYENGARPGENLISQLSPDRRHFRMQGRLRMGSSNEREETYARIREIAEGEFPGLVGGDSALSTLSLSGKTMLVDSAGLTIAKGYTRSIAVALAMICIFIGLVFRSVRFALLSLVPNIFPILVPISLLGFLGIALDGPAVVACSIALGLCVDDTIHLFSKFRDAERQGLRGQEAIAYALRECGNALTITTIVLVFGFLMMATGDFSPNVYIGLLGSTMILIAFLADVLVTPALLVASERFTRPGLRSATAVALVLLASSSAAAQTAVPMQPKFTPADPATYGRQLMGYADSFDGGWADEVLQGEMTLIDASGRSVSRAFVRMSLEGGSEGDKLVTRFTSPNVIRGVSALTHENSGGSDDNWLYLPATKRVRRISGANNTSSFLGTEFTYEDLSSLDPQEYLFTYLSEATLTIDGTERVTHKIDAVPTYADTGYSRLTIYLDPRTWSQVQIDYFDLAGALLKTRFALRLTQFHDRYWRAGQIEMYNHLSGRRTVLKIDSHLLNLSLYTDSRTGQPRQSLAESLFTTRSLVK
ncbi:MAG: outer membrane lipoprotein-sorting protein [Planctomycetota bacterium]|nr:outer membrane lipoprotein-sorting protein [Planctomycetota bacterium]